MKIALTTLLSIFMLQSFAQQNFQPGSIVKISGHTIKGFIDYRAWEKNPRSIRFRESEDGAIAVFTVVDLASFKVDGKDSYRRAEVEKDMRPVAVEEVHSLTRDSTATDTVFLRIVAEGDKLSLFELIDAKVHYYVQDSTQTYQELIYKVYSNGPQQHLRKTFRDQLKMYSNSDPNVLAMLESVEYDETDLAKVINLINGNESVPPARAGGTITVFFVTGGATYSSIKMEGMGKYDGMKPYSNVAPTFGIGIDVISKRHLGTLALRFEAVYTSSQYKGETSRTNQVNEDWITMYDFKMSCITPSVSLLVTPLRKPYYRLYAGIGMGLNIASYKGNVLREVNLTYNQPYERENFLELESSWPSVDFRLGAILYKFDINAGAKVFGNFERVINLNTHFDRFSLRAAYRF